MNEEVVDRHVRPLPHNGCTIGQKRKKLELAVSAKVISELCVVGAVA
jgi:hypothetical protein